MISPLLTTDFYKQLHFTMYPPKITQIYSNLTPRSSKIKEIDGVVVFGLQYFIQKYLMDQWNNEFFSVPLGKVIEDYRSQMRHAIGDVIPSFDHIESLHGLGYLPLHIKALPEGSICPLRIPVMTITNTEDGSYWLVNFLETMINCSLWLPITSATIGFRLRQILSHYAEISGASMEIIDFQAHDFSMRGMSSLESAMVSGAAHLLSFKGTDTVPSIEFLRRYYVADLDSEEIIGASVPASEHSVMSAGSRDQELSTFENLLSLYPKGVLSIVSDTWDLWSVLESILPSLKDKILSRDGKLVVRPDSGDPVKIICGDAHAEEGSPQNKGVLQLLWEIFGGSLNSKSFRVLDPHIGLIYGDGLSLEKIHSICQEMIKKSWSTSNIVFGVGSSTYQANTRDTFGFAMKATFAKIDGRNVSLFKAPATDSGSKHSAVGLLSVYRNSDGDLKLQEDCTESQESNSLLETVFLNGKITRKVKLSDIRERLLQSI